MHAPGELELARHSFSGWVCGAPAAGFPARCSPATVTACHQQRVARVRAVSETKTCCLRASAANCFRKKPPGPGPDRITYDALIVVRTASNQSKDVQIRGCSLVPTPAHLQMKRNTHSVLSAARFFLPCDFSIKSVYQKKFTVATIFMEPKYVS